MADDQFLSDQEARELYGEVMGEDPPVRSTFYRWRTKGFTAFQKTIRLASVPNQISKHPKYRRSDVLRFCSQVLPLSR